MPVPTQCFNIVRGRVMRVTALDECCSIFAEVDAPGCEVAVTDGIISAAMTAEIEDGESIRDRNWAGRLCVVDRSPDEFLYWNLEITFCQVDPSVVGLLTGLPLEMDDDTGQVVGFRSVEGALVTNAAIEMWSGISPVDCAAGEVTLGYSVFPCVTGGRLGDLTIENGRADFIISGAYTKSGAGWGSGPYDVVMDSYAPAPLPVPFTAGQHHLLRTTSVPAPEADCECMTLEEAGGTRPV